MKTVHFVMQGKGGVGKTFISSILAQYLQTSTDSRAACFDTDPVNKSFSHLKALEVTPVDLFTEHQLIDPGKFDVLMEQILQSDADVVVDNGASSFVPLLSYLRETKISALFDELGLRAIIHVPLQGGSSENDTLLGLATILDTLPIDVVPWINNYGGKVITGSKNFDDYALYKKYKNRIRGVISLDNHNPDTFGKDIRQMTSSHLTFDEVAQSANFFIINKQRILIFKRGIYEQLDALNLGEKNGSSIVEKERQI
ncbi:MAG TPA: conjugal transfer protein TraL [Advenella kashmirensis]|uniref:Conjugal transfer protein TraL n=1 Tax=Advenella kashmirensis TaxID=310575 RepID=A0A356LMI1_9BURK|nr:conjugal transfer protein TraL [Advenella kashmirensis]